MTDIYKEISYPRRDNPLSPPVGDKVELQFRRTVFFFFNLISSTTNSYNTHYSSLHVNI